MAAPPASALTLPGAPYGFNGKIVHATLGTLFVCVGAIQRNVSINTAEEIAAQAKTLYPLWVSQGGINLTLLHRDHAARDKVNTWVSTFMERSSRAQLDQNYVDVSIPIRRFTRRSVIQGHLNYGADVRDGMLRTTLTLVGANDPVKRMKDRSRMRHAPNSGEAMFFYPAGLQVGWDTIEKVYDVPPIRPGQPNRPV